MKNYTQYTVTKSGNIDFTIEENSYFDSKKLAIECFVDMVKNLGYQSEELDNGFLTAGSKTDEFTLTLTWDNFHNG